MSVAQQRRFNFRKHDVPAPIDAEFEDVECSVEPDSVTFKCTHENDSIQLFVLWISIFLFMLFVVSIIPAMKLTVTGNALAVMMGLLVLATVALIVQARVRTTKIRLGKDGIQVEQGTALDREVAIISWGDLGSVELEPVDPAKQGKGMHLELRPKQGEPIKALAGIGVGDQSAVRQAILKAWRPTAT